MSKTTTTNQDAIKTATKDKKAQDTLPKKAKSKPETAKTQTVKEDGLTNPDGSPTAKGELLVFIHDNFSEEDSKNILKELAEDSPPKIEVKEIAEMMRNMGEYVMDIGDMAQVVFDNLNTECEAEGPLRAIHASIATLSDNIFQASKILKESGRVPRWETEGPRLRDYMG